MPTVSKKGGNRSTAGTNGDVQAESRNAAPKGRDKRVPAAERREIILEAALNTFMEYGYHGARVNEIARRADVTRPILYRHFPSKLSMLIALVNRAGENLIRAMSGPPDEDLDWRESIRRDIHAYLDFVERYGKAYTLLYSTGLCLDREVSQRISAIRKRMTQIVEERIRHFTDMSRATEEEVEALAVMLVGMVEQAANHWMNEKRVSRRACEEYLVRAATGVLSRLPPRES